MINNSVMNVAIPLSLPVLRGRFFKGLCKESSSDLPPQSLSVVLTPCHSVCNAGIHPFILVLGLYSNCSLIYKLYV